MAESVNSLSVMEKFEIKSQLYNTYFPPPERVKTKHE